MVIKKKRLIFLFALMSASTGLFSTPVNTDEAFDYEDITRKSTLSERRIVKHLSRLKKSERTRSALRTFTKGSVLALFAYSAYQLLHGESQAKSQALKRWEVLPADKQKALEDETIRLEQLYAQNGIAPWYDRYYEKLPKLVQGICQSIIGSQLFNLVVRSTGLSFNIMDYLFNDDSLAWCIANKTTLEPVFIEMVKTKLRSEPECERLLQLFPIFTREAEKILAFMRHSERQFHGDYIRNASKSVRKTIHEQIERIHQQLDQVNDLRETFASWDTLTGEQRNRTLEQQVAIRAGVLASLEEFIKLLGGFWSFECAGRKRIGVPSSLPGLNGLLRKIDAARQEILVRFNNADDVPAGVIQN